MTEQQDNQGTATATADTGQADLDQLEQKGRENIQAVLDQIGTDTTGQPQADAKPTPSDEGSKATKPKPADSPKDNGAGTDKEAYTPTARQKKAAEQLGYTDDDQDALAERDFARLERQWSDKRKLEQTVGTLSQQVKGLQKAQQQPPTPKDYDGDDLLEDEPPARGSRRTADVDDRDLPSDLDELAVSPDDDADAVASKNRRLIGSVKAMQQQVQALAEAEEQRNQRAADEADKQVRRKTDEWFSSKLDPTDWANDDGSPMFGEGDLANMDGRSSEAKLRKAVMAKAAQIMSADGDDLDDALDTALLALHKDRYLTAAQKRKSSASNKKRDGSMAGATPKAAPATVKDTEREEALTLANKLSAVTGTPMTVG